MQVQVNTKLDEREKVKTTVRKPAISELAISIPLSVETISLWRNGKKICSMSIPIPVQDASNE